MDNELSHDALSQCPKDTSPRHRGGKKPLLALDTPSSLRTMPSSSSENIEAFIHITRHGERRDFVEQWTPGAWPRFDCPLSQTGHMQARELGQHLANTNFGIRIFYVSPFIRTIETALNAACEILVALQADAAAASHAELKILFRIEYGIGEYHEGMIWSEEKLPQMTPADVMQQFFATRPGVAHLRKYIEVDQEYVPTYGQEYYQSLAAGGLVEHFDGYSQRVKRTMDSISLRALECAAESTRKPRRVLVVGHAAGSIACVRALIGRPQYPVRCGICSLSTLRVESRETGSFSAELIRNGDASYLSGGEQYTWRFKQDRELPFNLETDVELLKVTPGDKQHFEAIKALVADCGVHMYVTYGFEHWMDWPSHFSESYDIDYYLLLLKTDNNRPIATFQVMDAASPEVPESMAKYHGWTKSSLPEDQISITYVKKLAVLPEYQQLGLGSYCMDRCHEIVAERALAQRKQEAWVRLNAVPNHRQLIEFYFRKLQYNKLEPICVRDGQWLVQCMDKCITKQKHGTC